MGNASLLANRGDDLQVEFVMLDPYVRLPLKQDGTGTFSVQFKVIEWRGFMQGITWCCWRRARAGVSKGHATLREVQVAGYIAAFAWHSDVLLLRFTGPHGVKVFEGPAGTHRFCCVLPCL
eukprot:186293-Pelagomonas_calceolata.AAC.3